MKKQILFLAIFTLAVFLAGTTKVVAQAVAGSAPQPLTCTTNAYNPIAGVPYDYSAGLSPVGGTSYWFATTSTTYITGGALVATEEAVGGTYVSAATNYRAAALAPTSPSTTNITWTTGGLALAKVLATEAPKLFVAVKYTATSPDCADNFKVYPVRPVNAFTVDIKNMTSGTTQTSLGYNVLDEQCFDLVQSAVYVSGVDGSVDYDFGTQRLYYEVVAANFTGTYTPTFRLSGMATDQTADIDWGYTIGSYTNSLATGVGNGDYTTAANAVTTAATNTSAGVSIYVRVTIHNNDFEGLATTPIALAVDAINSASEPDVVNSDCTTVSAFEDVANQNLKLRPTVSSVAPNVFLPVQP